MPRVNIKSMYGVPWQTQVTNSETGETIPNVFAFEIAQDVSRPKENASIVVTLHCRVGQIDVTGDASIVAHCPHCEKELPLLTPHRPHEISLE